MRPSIHGARISNTRCPPSPDEASAALALPDRAGAAGWPGLRARSGLGAMTSRPVRTNALLHKRILVIDGILLKPDLAHWILES
jgi:hypothetical protein